MSNDLTSSRSWVSYTFPRFTNMIREKKTSEEPMPNPKESALISTGLSYESFVKKYLTESSPTIMLAEPAPKKPKSKYVSNKPIVVKTTFNPKKIHRFLIRKTDIVFYVPVGVLKVEIKDNIKKELDKIQLGSKESYLTDKWPISSITSQYSVDPDQIPSCKHNVKSSGTPNIQNKFFQWSQPKEWRGTHAPAYDACISPEILKDTKQVPIGCDFQGTGINYCPNYEPEQPEVHTLSYEGNEYQLEIQPVYTSRNLSYALRDSDGRQIFTEVLGYPSETAVDIVTRKTQMKMTLVDKVVKTSSPKTKSFLSNLITVEE